MATNTTDSDNLSVDAVSGDNELTNASNADEKNGSAQLSEIDRFQKRVERFGTITSEGKKLSRALRFGTAHEAIDSETKKRRLERFGHLPDSAESEQEKKRQRAERFCVNNPTTTVDDEAKQKRIDRFGVVTPSTTTSTKKKFNQNSASVNEVASDAMKKRTERFGPISNAAKADALSEQKVKRAERFKTITSA